MIDQKYVNRVNRAVEGLPSIDKLEVLTKSIIDLVSRSIEDDRKFIAAMRELRIYLDTCIDRVVADVKRDSHGTSSN